MLSITSLALILAAQAQEAPPIVNGERTDDFPAVGTLMGYSERYGGAPFCSATLIHRRWVVTAAHCLDAADQYSRYDMDILFVVGDDLFSSDGIEDYGVAVDWIEHPDYSGTSRGIRADIGLVELSEPMVGIDPVRLNEDEPTDDWRGEELHYVGWGITGDDRNDSGRKRYAAIPYYDADSDFIYAYDAEKNLCSGDSGGAGMREDADGVMWLAGVNSFVFAYQDANTPCEGGGSGATRVDQYYDWIAEYVNLTPVAQGGPVALGVDGTGEEDEIKGGCSTVSGDFGWAATLFGLVLVGARRRERS